MVFPAQTAPYYCQKKITDVIKIVQ